MGSNEIMNKILSIIKNEVQYLRSILYYRMLIKPDVKDDILDKFHKLYYGHYIVNKTWANTYWLGIPLMKCPFDLWIYQEILYETRPDIIIETGTWNGGSTLFLAHICDILGQGEIITIDTEKTENRPAHNRIQYFIGSSISDEMIIKIREEIKNKQKIMVVLDSMHQKKHVLKELNIYNKFVTPGCYLIVEDTNMNGHPIKQDFGDGPMEAVQEFIKLNNNFIIDEKREKLLLTFNPKGYLKKIN